MKTNFVSALLIIIGAMLIISEQVFSYYLFEHTSTIGFIVIVAGVLLLSFKIVKESRKVRAKYYDQFPGTASGYFPNDLEYHLKNPDSDSFTNPDQGADGNNK